MCNAEEAAVPKRNMAASESKGPMTNNADRALWATRAGYDTWRKQR